MASLNPLWYIKVSQWREKKHFFGVVIHIEKVMYACEPRGSSGGRLSFFAVEKSNQEYFYSPGQSWKTIAHVTNSRGKTGKHITEMAEFLET